MKKVKGSISIYLCIVFLSIIVLVSVLAERSRISTIQSKCKAVTYMATESVLAGYGKQVFEDYGLLLAWENVSVEESLEEYMQANINKADLSGMGTNFMDTVMVDIAECNKKYITDESGTLFLEQVKKYIKYAGVLKNAEDLVSIFTDYTKSNDTDNKKDESNITSVAEKNSDKLQSIVEDINKQIEKIKDVEKLTEKYTVFEQCKVENNTKKIQKVYKEILIILEDKEKNIDKSIILINDYKIQKELFLNENGYTENINDYIEDNLEILEKLEDKIVKIKELDVSKISKESPQGLDEVSLCIKNILINIDNLETNIPTEKDRENASVFDRARELMNRGIVALVMQNSKNISQNAIATNNLPSNLEIQNSEETLLDKANLLVYANMKFGNYLNTKQNTALKYEIEYLVGGKRSDSDNLAETIKQIIAVRNVINIGILLTDKQKMGQISTISTSVAAITGLPFMETVAKAVLIETWSLAESVYEVKSLLMGNKLPMVKGKENWNINLDNMLKEPQKDNLKNGIDYATYCNFLLMMQSTNDIAYKMMDLIQENIQFRYNPEFLMEKCFTTIEVKANFNIKPLFMAMPWTLNMDSGEDLYRFQILWENTY